MKRTLPTPRDHILGMLFLLPLAVPLIIAILLVASFTAVSAIPSCWRRLLNSGYGWSPRQKPLLPRSAYTWMRN